MAKKLLQRNDARVLGKKLKRALVLSRENLNLDEEARTVEIAFSSDTAVEHWFGRLILDHSPSSIRLDRLKQGGPFLTDHDRTKQIGVHESVKNDGHICRAMVRFSKRPSAQEEFQDVIDGIRRGISCGFIVHELHLEREDDDGPVYRSTDWEPVENSLVSIPADLTVGVGRAMDEAEECEEEQERDAEEEERTASDDAAAEAREQEPQNNSGGERAVPTQTTEVRKPMDREEELRQLGDMLGEVELARDFIADESKTVAEFRSAVREKRKAAKTPTPTEEPEEVALRNGGNVQLARTSSRVQLKAFRGQDGARQAHRFGNFLAAAVLRDEGAREFCRENGISIKRAHSESDNETGGFLVPTEFEQTIIDLRLQYGVFRRNANVVPMSGGRREQPRRKGGLKAYPIGAGKNNRRLTESKQNWDMVGLDPKKWGVLAKYEEELSEDWLIATGDNFANEAAQAFARVEDECGFIGDGSSDYHGIVGVIPKIQGLSNTVANIAGIQVASGNLWSEIVKEDILALVGKLPSFARMSGNVKWYCTNEFWATVLCRIALSLGGVTMAEIEGEMRKVFLGQVVEEVEVMPHVEANSQIPLLYGNLGQAAQFGDRRGMTVKMTDSDGDDFDEDIQAWKATERFDINSHDVGNADATANKRKAGPIVALQTATS